MDFIHRLIKQSMKKIDLRYFCGFRFSSSSKCKQHPSCGVDRGFHPGFGWGHISRSESNEGR